MSTFWESELSSRVKQTWWIPISYNSSLLGTSLPAHPPLRILPIIQRQHSCPSLTFSRKPSFTHWLENKLSLESCNTPQSPLYSGLQIQGTWLMLKLFTLYLTTPLAIFHCQFFTVAVFHSFTDTYPYSSYWTSGVELLSSISKTVSGMSLKTEISN